MYDGGRIRLAATHAAKSTAHGTVKTMPYRFGLLALLVQRLNMEVVLRDGLHKRNERGDGEGPRPRFVSSSHCLPWRASDVFSPRFHQPAPFVQHVGPHVGLCYRVSNSMC